MFLLQFCVYALLSWSVVDGILAVQKQDVFYLLMFLACVACAAKIKTKIEESK